MKRLVLLLLIVLASASCDQQPVRYERSKLPTPVRVAVVGDVARHTKTDDATARLAASAHPDAVLLVGDAQYRGGFEEDFDRSWGRFRSMTYAVAGDHDCTDAASCAAYRARFAPRTEGRTYAFRLGSWFVAALDSTGDIDRQTAWLERKLAADASYCQLLFWHDPRFSSARGSAEPRLDPWWRLAYDDSVDIVLSGNAHQYERFARVRPDGRPAADGPRQFVVGTGGATLAAFDTPLEGSERRVRRHGVLVMSLMEASYWWRFEDVDGRVRDSGRETCHDA
jgi:hypothetical protein